MLPNGGRRISRNVFSSHILVDDVYYCIINTEQTSENIFTYDNATIDTDT